MNWLHYLLDFGVSLLREPEPRLKEMTARCEICMPKMASYGPNNVPLGYVYAAPAQGAKNGATGPSGTSSSGL